MKNLLLPLCCVLLFTASFSGQSAKTEANPKAVSALTNGRFSDAIAILDKDIRNEKNLFPSYVLRADIKRMTGDLAGALADINSALAIKVDDGSLYERRADLRLFLRHDMKDVLADLESAVTHGVKNERVFAQRGQMRSWTGDHEGAVADLRAAIGMKPNYARAYVALSGVYRRQNDDDAAIKVLEEFISGIEPAAESAKPVDGKAVIITGIELEKPKGSEMRPGQETVVIGGRTVMNGPPTPEKMREMTDRMEQSKNTALAYFTLADMYVRKEQMDEASGLVAKGLAIDPSDYYGYDVRGQIKVAKGDYAGGIDDLSRAIKAFPPNPGPYLERAIAYIMLGKDAEAQQDIDTYLQRNPAAKPYVDQRIRQARAAKPQ